MSTTLFGHLVTRLGPEETENIATEALAYILRGSEHARASLAGILQSTAGPHSTSDFWITTQQRDSEHGIPDIGLWNAGVKVALLEVKFWAELTDNQPARYLDSLDPGGTLLFVAPDRRLPQLWSELLRRCSGRAMEAREDHGGGLTAVRVGERTLALVSWQALLTGMRGSAERGGAQQTVADIDQLVGLVEHLDRTEFLPLGDDETGSLRGRRVRDFLALGRSLSDRLAIIDGITRLPKNSWGLDGNVGWWFDVPQRVWIGYFPSMWAQHGVSPLWMMVGATRQSPPYISSDEAFRLVAAAATDVQRSDEGSVYVPLELLAAAGRNDVLAALLDRACAIIVALGGEIRPPSSAGQVAAKDEDALEANDPAVPSSAHIERPGDL